MKILEMWNRDCRWIRAVSKLAAFRMFAASLALLLLAIPSLGAQKSNSGAALSGEGPAETLEDLLTSACRQDVESFQQYLTKWNAAAFARLPETEQLEILKRISLTGQPGRPLLSSDLQKNRILACEDPSGTVNFKFGAIRTEENLSFISVEAGGRSTEFGMVREGGGWRLLSLGLLVFDIPELQRQWTSEDLAAREDAVIKTLRALADAVDTYQKAFGELPEKLSQLGPATDGVSPAAADLIAGDLAAGSREGYAYRYRLVQGVNGATDKFELAATPEQYGKTGRRSFLLDTSGKIRGADKHGDMATTDDPLLNESDNANE